MWLAVAGVASGGCAVAGVWISALVRAERVESRLRSPEADVRQRAAWVAADERLEECLATIRTAVREGRERDPRALEAFVYALGLVGAPGDWDLLAGVAQTHPDGYVRQAAWLAAARVSPERCGELLKGAPEPDNDWDRLGRASAQCELGDVAGVPALLELAGRGDDAQRVIASRSLAKYVKPALESLGRWPLDLEAPVGAAWRGEDLVRIAARCDAPGLGAVLASAATHEQRSREIRRKQLRLTRARDRIARILFPGN